MLGTGGGDQNRATTDIYDPVKNTWSRVANLLAGRTLPTATLLPNGKILVAGGTDSAVGALDSVEPYDPVANTWTYAASMSTGRINHTGATDTRRSRCAADFSAATAVVVAA